MKRSENENTGERLCTFPVKIFEGKFSWQNTQVTLRGWCEVVSKETRRRVRTRCWGQHSPMSPMSPAQWPSPAGEQQHPGNWQPPVQAGTLNYGKNPILQMEPFCSTAAAWGSEWQGMSQPGHHGRWGVGAGDCVNKSLPVRSRL